MLRGGAFEVVLRNLRAQIFALNEAEKRPRQHEDQPCEKADQAFQDGAADEEPIAGLDAAEAVFHAEEVDT